MPRLVVQRLTLGSIRISVKIGGRQDADEPRAPAKAGTFEAGCHPQPSRLFQTGVAPAEKCPVMRGARPAG